MPYLAIVAPLVVAIFAVWMSFSAQRQRARECERRESAWQLERRDLLNRIMFLSEKPWEAPEVKAEPQPPSPPSEVVDPLLEAI